MDVLRSLFGRSQTHGIAQLRRLARSGHPFVEHVRSWSPRVPFESTHTEIDTEEMVSVKRDVPDEETQDQTDEQGNGPSHRNADDDQKLETNSTSETARN